MRTQEGKRARDTHYLESASGKTSEDKKIKQTSDGHSLSGDHIRWVRSGHRKNVSRRRPQTCCRAQREEQMKKQKASERARGTYRLEDALGGTS